MPRAHNLFGLPETTDAWMNVSAWSRWDGDFVSDDGRSFPFGNANAFGYGAEKQLMLHRDPFPQSASGAFSSSPPFNNLVGGGGPQQVNEPTDVIPGNTSTTFTLAVGASDTGVVNFVGDHDWFRIELVAGQSYAFTIVGSGPTPVTDGDTYLELYDSTGQLIAIDDDAGPGLSSLIRFTATASGTYYLGARAFEDTGVTNTGGYTISAAIGPAQDPLDTIDLHFVMPTTTIEIYFATTGQSFGPPGALDTAVRSWTQAEINAVFAALATYSAITPLTFTQTTNSANAEWILTLDNDLGDPNVLGHFFAGSPVGYGAFNPNGAGWATGLTAGGLGFVTLIHEFGHGLGLAHPHDNGAIGYGTNNSEIMQGVIDAFNSFGTFGLNQGVYTTMSYNDGWQTSPWGQNFSLTTGSQATPMALDVALLQQLYGVNPNTNAGDTTYNLLSAASAYRTIWDTGGTDTIAYSGSLAVMIDLRAATLLNQVGGGGFVSYATGVHGGYTIANGVVLENATGGTNADTIIGNSVGNRLTGGAGGDAITGGGGIDTSVYSIASTSATWVRNPNGSWTVTAGADGVDTVVQVERLDFSDRDVVLDNAFRTFSGDGTSDLMWRNLNTGAVAVWEMSGAVQTNAYIAGGAPAEWTLLGSGDFSGDGRDDIIWRNTTTTAVAVWADGQNAAASIVTGVPGVWEFAGIGDFNFDGRDDFLWRNTSDGAVAAWLMNGAAIVTQSIVSAAPLSWDIVGIADFDGDGRDDILLRNSDGALARWSTDGVVQTGAAIIGTAPNEWSVAGTGDFDGDGRADILWRNGNDGAVAMWRMNGDAVLGQAIVGAAPLAWGIANVGDYNGDGRDDIMLRNSDGTLALWTMNGFSVAAATIVGVVPTEWSLG